MRWAAAAAEEGLVTSCTGVGQLTGSAVAISERFAADLSGSRWTPHSPHTKICLSLCLRDFGSISHLEQSFSASQRGLMQIHIPGVLHE